MANNQYSIQDDLRWLHEVVEKLQQDHPYHSPDMKTVVLDQFTSEAQSRNRPQLEEHDVHQHETIIMEQRARHQIFHGYK